MIYYIYAFILGAVVGSFLNVIISRLPAILLHDAEMSLALPRSFCPHCKQSLSWWQNIPLISYIILRGKCHFCAKSISPRYLVVELMCAVLTAMMLYAFDGYQLIIACIFCWLLVPLAFIDAKYQILPDELTIFGIWVGIFLSSLEQTSIVSLTSSIYGVMLGYVSLWGIRYIYLLWKKQEMMGLGDAKMLAMIGAFLGVQSTIFTMMLSSILGILYFLAISIRRKTLNLSIRMPYGVFLAIAGFALLCLKDIV